MFYETLCGMVHQEIVTGDTVEVRQIGENSTRNEEHFWPTRFNTQTWEHKMDMHLKLDTCRARLGQSTLVDKFVNSFTCPYNQP